MSHPNSIKAIQLWLSLCLTMFFCFKIGSLIYEKLGERAFGWPGKITAFGCITLQNIGGIDFLEKNYIQYDMVFFNNYPDTLFILFFNRLTTRFMDIVHFLD